MNLADITVPVVRGLSYRKIEEHALEFLTIAAPECLESPRATPVLEIFENKLDLFGYSVLIGKNVKGLDGFTDVTNKVVQLPLATHKRLEKGDQRSRYTVAHECGHVKLHDHVVSLGDFHSRDQVVFARRSQLKAYEDPEWQANAFAAALLMPIGTMRMLFDRGEMTIENVMEIYQVSRAAASRRVMKLTDTFSK